MHEAQRLAREPGWRGRRDQSPGCSQFGIDTDQFGAHREPRLFAENGDRARQCRRLRVKVVDTQQHRGGDALRRHAADGIWVDRLAGIPPRRNSPSKLGEQKWIAACLHDCSAAQFRTRLGADGRTAPRAPPRIHSAAADEGSACGLAQAVRQIRPVHIGPGSNCQCHDDGQARQSIGEVQQEAK